jgi:transposase
MGSGTKKAAAVNLRVNANPHWRDTLSKKTAATSAIQITSAPALLVAFELGEESWLLGLSRGFGERVLRHVVGLLDLLARHLAGSHKRPFSVVSVPSVEAEDLRHLGRELKLAKKDRTRISNRMKGLLANHGLVLSSRRDLRQQIERLRMWDGAELPRFLKARLLRYADDFEAHAARIRALEQERRQLLREERSHTSMEKVWRLLELKGVGIETAWCYGMELFGWRQFANRKQVGSLAGLTPTPHDSGQSERERGIGKDGSRWVRGVAIEQAWAWLRFQPDSELSQWYQSRFGGGSKRLRKIGIVALARKLLIALWRFVEFGEVPAGAAPSTRQRLA